MRRIVLPTPPNPDAFAGNMLAYARSTYQWQLQVKSLVEQASQINDVPLDQVFQVSGSYAIATSISGTSTGTQITEFLCSLVKSMERRGLTSPKPQGG